jgi:VanZ family protein
MTFPPLSNRVRQTRDNCRGLLFVAAMWVVALTWFPFKFVDSLALYGQGLAEMLTFRPDWQLPLHALVWFALGILAGLSTPAWSAARSIVVGVLVMLLATVVLETVQAGVIDRHATVADIFVDMLAGTVGLVVIVNFRHRARQSRPVLVATRLVAILAAALVAVAAPLFAVAVHVGDHARNWDERYPLTLGNEQGGERPWLGEITLAAVYPNRLDDDAITELAATTTGDKSLALRRRLGAIAIYPFIEGVGESVADHGGGEEPIDLVISAPDAAAWTADGLRLISPGRLQSRESARPITLAVADRGALTVELLAAPATLAQSGPARMLSLSGGTDDRNFTLGQNGRALSFRVRTVAMGANGVRGHEPQWHDVFYDHRRRHLLATWENAQLTLYVDGVRQPQTIKLYTARMVLGIGRVWGDYLFFAIVFLPLGVLVRIVCDDRGAAALRWTFLAVLSWAAALVVCGVVYARPIEWGPLLVAALVAALGASGFHIAREESFAETVSPATDTPRSR